MPKVTLAVRGIRDQGNPKRGFGAKKDLNLAADGETSKGIFPCWKDQLKKLHPKTMDGSDLRNSRKERSLWSRVWGALPAAFRAAAVHTNNAAEGRRQKGRSTEV